LKPGAAVGAASLPSAGLDQLIEAVINVIADRVDPLVGEVAHRQGGVFDTKHIAHRVIVIIQVLQRVRAASGLQLAQPAIFGGVLQRGDDPVACGFLFCLALGVLLDGADQGLRLRLPVQLQSNGMQQAVAGLAEELAVIFCVGLFDGFAQGIETCTVRPPGT